MTCSEEDALPETTHALAAELASAVSKEDRSACAELVPALARELQIPRPWTHAIVDALKADDWSEVGRLFVREAFVGSRGSYLIVGPYTQARSARRTTCLSLCVGTVLPHVLLARRITRASARVFGTAPPQVSHVIPVRPIATAGSIGAEGGEAFIVPDGWNFPGSPRGPALNDMPNQAARLEGGWPALGRIFGRTAATSMRSLLRGTRGWAVRSDEYTLHDGGHASGVGLEALISAGLLELEHAWNRGVEEARADWVSFVLAPKVLGYRRAGMVFLSNLATRFGVDAHRRGGFDLDPDVIAATLTLDRLIGAGMVDSHGGQLQLHLEPFDELGRRAELLGAAGVELTRAVLRERDLNAVDRLYGSLGQNLYATRIVFDALVRNPGKVALKSMH